LAIRFSSADPAASPKEGAPTFGLVIERLMSFASRSLSRPNTDSAVRSADVDAKPNGEWHEGRQYAA
jgi:hypothetical protein